MKNFLDAVNLIAKGCNEASAFWDELNNKPLQGRDIATYFATLREISLRQTERVSLALLNFFEDAAMNQLYLPVEDPVVKTAIQECFAQADVMIAKTPMHETLLAANNRMLENDKELRSIECHNLRSAMLEMTPIIKSKVKKAIKESVDLAKKMAEQQKISEGK